jgi:uncharacterized repeat protein (TIGR02543 family)
MNNSTGGSSVTPSDGWHNSGESVGISATAASGYTFSSWTGSGAGSYSGSSNAASVTMNAPVTETANFTSIGYAGKQYGDFDNNHVVNLTDFNILVNAWGTTYALVDFNNLVNHWQQNVGQ